MDYQYVSRSNSKKSSISEGSLGIIELGSDIHREMEGSRKDDELAAESEKNKETFGDDMSKKISNEDKDHKRNKWLEGQGHGDKLGQGQNGQKGQGIENEADENNESEEMVQESAENNLNEGENYEDTKKPAEALPEIRVTFQEQVHLIGTGTSREHVIETPTSRDDVLETTTPRDDVIETTTSRDNVIETPTDDVTETTTPRDDLIETTTSRDDVTETTTPTDDIIETTTPTDDVTENTTPTDDITENSTLRDDIIETTTPRDDVIETTTPTDDVIETTTPTDYVTENTTPTDDITENSTLREDVIETTTPRDDVIETTTPTDDVIETTTPTDYVTENTTPTDDITENSTLREDVIETTTPRDDVIETTTPRDDVIETTTPRDDVKEELVDTYVIANDDGDKEYEVEMICREESQEDDRPEGTVGGDAIDEKADDAKEIMDGKLGEDDPNVVAESRVQDDDRNHSFTNVGFKSESKKGRMDDNSVNKHLGDETHPKIDDLSDTARDMDEDDIKADNIGYQRMGESKSTGAENGKTGFLLTEIEDEMLTRNKTELAADVETVEEPEAEEQEIDNEPEYGEKWARMVDFLQTMVHQPILTILS